MISQLIIKEYHAKLLIHKTRDFLPENKDIALKGEYS